MTELHSRGEAPTPRGPAAQGRTGSSGEMTRRSVEVILTQTRAGAHTAVLMGAMYGLILVPAGGWGRYLAWYAVLAGFMLARQPYFNRLVAREGVSERTLRRIALVAAFTGWLSALCMPLFAADLPVTELSVLTILLTGWVALAVSVLAVQPRIYAGYIAACMSTIFVGWIVHGATSALLLLGVAMVLGGGMLAKLARELWAQLRDTVDAAEQKAQLVDQLRDALQLQQEAQQARSRFLGAASHDLRQPIQALLFLSDIFRRSGDGQRRERLAQQIVRTGESIDTMFRHLVDFAQIDAGTMKSALQPVDLTRLVQAAVSGFVEKCASKGLRFRLDAQAGGTVAADPVLLERVLRNFLDNAWKYSLRGEIVLAVRQVGDVFEVSVQDEGVGMDEEDMAQVGHAFHRGRSAMLAEAEGIGLGLAICRHMADLMHAKLELSSQPGKGTRAAIRVPVRPAAAPAPSAAVNLRPAVLVGLLVAVLENDRLARQALCAWLQDAGAETVAAAELAPLQQALREAGRAPDFVVADYRLSVGNGADAIAALRAEHGEVPALVISGEANLDELQLGVPFLQKPVTPEKLLVHLQRALPARPEADLVR